MIKHNTFLTFQEALKDYPAVFWIDTSVRFTEQAANLSTLFNYLLTKSHGILLFQNNKATHSNYAATHPSMYNYLPTNVDKQKAQKQYGSGTMLFYRTKWAMENILYWFALCALDKECIAPRGSKLSHKGITGPLMYRHRYDQAAINILMCNAFHFNTSEYVYPEKLLEIIW